MELADSARSGGGASPADKMTLETVGKEIEVTLRMLEAKRGALRREEYMRLLSMLEQRRVEYKEVMRRFAAGHSIPYQYVMGITRTIRAAHEAMAATSVVTVSVEDARDELEDLEAKLLRRF